MTLSVNLKIEPMVQIMNHLKQGVYDEIHQVAVVSNSNDLATAFLAAGLATAFLAAGLATAFLATSTAFAKIDFFSAMYIPFQMNRESVLYFC